ncbi:MAG TPA: hypothetical protein VGH84_10690 [Steroidobacteraceae bacterium]|jgi:integrase
MDISGKKTRERLTPKREPYWQRLKKGSYLGFRRGPDSWVVRHRGRDGAQVYHALGEGMDFDAAKTMAEGWLAQVAGSAVRRPKRGTVRQALEAYVADLKMQGREGTATEVEGRFKTTVWEDALAETVLETCTLEDVTEWRQRLRHGRQNRSVNRQVRAVLAGVRRAKQLGHVVNLDAFDVQPLVDDVEDDGETAIFLNPDQRTGLIKVAPPSLARFLRGLELSGARPSELASATVGDFTGDTLKLSHRKGRAAKLRTRFTVIAEEDAEFLKEQCRDKLPTALLFTEDGEARWRRFRWARGIQTAIKLHNKKARGAARIPPLASAYSFRHARISELLQIHAIDPLTVASQTGTSVAMIEKAYLRFIPNAMREKLKAVKEG